MFYGAGNLAAFSFQVVPSRFAASSGRLGNNLCHHCLYMANRWSAKPIWRFASAIPHKLKSLLQQTVHNTKKILTSEDTDTIKSRDDAFVVPSFKIPRVK
jgi:hypothetical protein